VERNDNICRHTNRQSRTVQKLRPPYPQVSSRETRAKIPFSRALISSVFEKIAVRHLDKIVGQLHPLDRSHGSTASPAPT